MATLAAPVSFPAADDAPGGRRAAADEEAVVLVSDSGEMAWRRPGELGGASAPVEGQVQVEPAPAVDAAGPEGTATALPATTSEKPIDAAAVYVEHEPGSPMPRSWLIALAGAVMGGILSIAIYSQAVGSNSGNNTFAFGGPGGGPGGRQGQFQGAPNQGAIPNQGGFQQNQGAGQNQGQVNPGQGQGNGGAGQQAFPGQAAVLGALPRFPDFAGAIRNISGSSMTVETQQGTRVVQVDSSTQVVRSDGSSGSASDLSRGAVVAVVASADPNTRLLRADAVGILR